MKFIATISLFLFSLFIKDCFSEARGDSTIGHYFYEDIGCTKKDGEILEYECPDFSLKNDTCRFKNKNLILGERVDKEVLKGSCNADCVCGSDGRISCAHYDCFGRLASGCSHYKYSLDSCCNVGSVCGPIAECNIEGVTHKEGEKVHLKKSCDVCVCDDGFKPEAPFCRPRKCYDQAYHQHEVSSYGAPVFFQDENCCPTTWTTDEGEAIVLLRKDLTSDSDVSCKFGNRKVKLGYGFQKSVTPYSREVPLNCICAIPPLVICREDK